MKFFASSRRRQVFLCAFESAFDWSGCLRVGVRCFYSYAQRINNKIETTTDMKTDKHKIQRIKTIRKLQYKMDLGCSRYSCILTKRFQKS